MSAELGWNDLAKKTLAILREKANQDNDFYTYYLDQAPNGVELLASALAEANRALLWKDKVQGVPNGH